MARGHAVTAWEPSDSWSAANLVANHGEPALDAFREAYPDLPVRVYDPATLDLSAALDAIDLAIVHEWNEPSLVAAIGSHRQRNPALRILFHDTHHRSVTDVDGLARYDLAHYDGVLAFGESVREQYRKHGWASRAWTFHEAADTRVFYPMPRGETSGDIVWIGNWGDDEREAELRGFLIEPVRDLQLRAAVCGVRYPAHALAELQRAGIAYHGWLPNYRAPAVFSQYRFTVHIPRRPYAEALPGVPTIRVFEALACGIPLISAPWTDSESLFPAGSYLTAANGAQMRLRMRAFLHDSELCRSVAQQGLAAIRQRHTCAHRATELLNIFAELAPVRAGVAA